MIYALVASAVLLVFCGLLAVVLFLQMKALYARLIHRHVAIAMLLVAQLGNDAKLMKRVRNLGADDLPEFLEDLRDMIRKNPNTAAGMPDDSKEDREFVMLLLMRGLSSGAGNMAIMDILPSMLDLSPYVKKVVALRAAKGD
jgi:hypothetical protein